MPEIDFSALCDFFKSHDDYLLLAHERPDADTLGSCAALALLLRSLGKTAEYACADKIPQTLLFITGQGDKRIPQGYAYKTIVTVDIASAPLAGEYESVARRAALALDHHVGHTFFAELEYVDSNAAATAEIVYRLCSALENEISPAEADYIYSALVSDTGGFRYANTTAESFRIARELVLAGANAPLAAKRLFEEKPLASIKAEAFGALNMKLSENGKIAVLKISHKDKKRIGFTDEDASDVINVLRSVGSVVVAAVARQRDGGENEDYKISLRSKIPQSGSRVNCAEICALFGGGGHEGAAGFGVSCREIAPTLKRLESELKKYV